MEARLKTGVWVQAQVRRCDMQFIPIAVVRKGDPDAGAVLLKLNRRDEGCTVLSQTRDREGRPAWMRASGPNPVPEADADAYIQRQVSRDPDLWVVEIDDPAGRYEIDGPIL